MDQSTAKTHIRKHQSTSRFDGVGKWFDAHNYSVVNLLFPAKLRPAEA
jgi:hypothetical protein